MGADKEAAGSKYGSPDRAGDCSTERSLAHIATLYGRNGGAHSGTHSCTDDCCDDGFYHDGDEKR